MFRPMTRPGTCPDSEDGPAKRDVLAPRVETLSDGARIEKQPQRPFPPPQILSVKKLRFLFLAFCLSVLFLAFLDGTESLAERCRICVAIMHAVARRVLALLGVGSLLAGAGVAQQKFTPIIPPSYPLAVRNPYLQAWLPGASALNLPSAQAEFWTGTTKLGWGVQARIDGEIFDLFGVPSGSSPARVLAGEYTSTHSIFHVEAIGVIFELDFFSPVSPNNLLRQSLPFSYLTVTVSYGDGRGVELMSWIDESWTGQTGSTNYGVYAKNGIVMRTLNRKNVITFSESKDMADWGTAVYAAKLGDGYTVSSATAPLDDLRQQFATAGSLAPNNSEPEGSAVGIAYDLGTMSGSASVNFAVGHVRMRAIDYLGTPQTHYYRATYPTTFEAVTHFFDDYEAAYAESKEFDKIVFSKGYELGGQNYSDILSLSVRQILGGTDVVIPWTKEVDQTRIFIKEISSNGNLNTVDIIFPTFPFFYIFSPNWIRLLMDPTIEYLETGRYKRPYVIHDMGSRYPNATGHDDLTEERMPVEETGNLLILLLAYQTATGDTSWRDAHRPLFDGYADYLIRHGLYPTLQLSTNDGLGPFRNMTNLAVKAAVALDAYAAITGNTSYHDIALDFADVIYTEGLGVRRSPETGGTVFKLTYHFNHWFMLFNLYPQRLFGLHTFPQAAFAGQSDWYAYKRFEYGLPIDGAVRWGKTDWQMWCAAVASPATQGQMIADLHKFISNGLNTQPFSDRYYARGPEAGQVANNFRNRPTLGGHFALWALKLGPLEFPAGT